MAKKQTKKPAPKAQPKKSKPTKKVQVKPTPKAKRKAVAAMPTHGRASSADPVPAENARLPAPVVLVPPQDSDFVLINHTKLTIVKVVPTQRQAEYQAALLCPGHEVRILSRTKRELCIYGAMELGWLFTNSGGHFYKWSSYTEGLNATAALIRAMPVDDTPETMLAERLGRTLPATGKRTPFIGSSAGHQFHMDARGVDIMETPPRGVAEVPTDRPPPPPPAPGEVAAQVAEVLGPNHQPTSAPQASPKGKRGRGAKAQAAGDAQAQPKTPREPKRQAAAGEFVPSPKGQKLWDACDAHRKAHKGQPPGKDEAVRLGVAVGLSEASAAVSFGRWKKQRGV